MKNAVGKFTCKTCPYWHNPAKQPIAFCIYDAPKPLIVGEQQIPAPVIVDPKNPMAGAMRIPVASGFFPTTQESQGCGRHPGRTNGIGVVVDPHEDMPLDSIEDEMGTMPG